MPTRDALFARLISAYPGMAYRCLHDANWTLEYASEGCEGLLGYTQTELVAERVISVSELIHPEDLPRVSLEVEKALTEHAPFAGIYRIRKRDGTLRWISEVAHGVFDEAGELVAIEGFLSDVTREVEGREATRLAEREKIIARMASGIAHDFNNLLTGIAGSVGALRDDATVRSSEALEELAAIDQVIVRAVALSRQLVDFGRPRSASANVLDLAAAVAAFKPVLERVVGSGLELRLDVPSRAVPCRVDEVYFEQLLLNLVVNARDATPRGGVITVRCSDADGEATLEVEDTGAGIDPGKLDRIFEPYFTTKELGVGTGLGLATVRGIVNEANGKITVRSELGRGTQFRVTLPIASQTATTTSDPVGSEVILLAEDDETVRGVLARGLRRLGYTVLEASDGAQAIRVSDRHKGSIDLLITDGKMPNLGGLELAEKLRQTRPQMPAMLLTGDQVRGRPGLFALQEQKPVSPRELAAHCRRILDQALESPPSRLTPPPEE